MARGHRARTTRPGPPRPSLASRQRPVARTQGSGQGRATGDRAEPVSEPCSRRERATSARGRRSSVAGRKKGRRDPADPTSRAPPTDPTPPRLPDHPTPVPARVAGARATGSEPVSETVLGSAEQSAARTATRRVRRAVSQPRDRPQGQRGGEGAGSRARRLQGAAQAACGDVAAWSSHTGQGRGPQWPSAQRESVP